jgi:hypothetical protein
MILEDRVDERGIRQQLRRDRGVRADSEEALIALRRERGDQLANAGGQR